MGHRSKTALNKEPREDDFELKRAVFVHARENQRSLPNILVSGTPGTGKTRLVDVLLRRGLAPHLSSGGCVLDFHSIDVFRANSVDLVVVLTTDTAILYDRLSSRGYSEHKVRENVECEIMNVLIEEARNAFENVLLLPSNTDTDTEQNTLRILSILK